MRVLLIAEACNPEWASVPLVGYSHARALMKLVDAHLVTQVRNREALLRAGLVEGKEFTSINSEAVAIPLRKLAGVLGGKDGRGWTSLTASAALYYYYFEHLLWKEFGARISSGQFDVVHRLTPLSPTVPSLIAKKCRRVGVPFVLGPLNGGVPWPKGFAAARKQEHEWLSYLRGAYRLLPGYRSTRKNAAAILIGSRDSFRQMPAAFQSKCIYMPENAVDPQRFHISRNRKASLPIRAIFVGRLVPYKGADMLVEAVAPLIKEGLLELDILGDGPELETLRRIVAEQCICDRVRLLGWVKHEELQQKLADADVFAFPSIREFGGGAVLEAMAVGVPAMVVNYGGPGELVTPESGWLVPVGPRKEIVERFRSLLSQLCRNPSLIDSRSELARRRVCENFTWAAKSKRVLQIYERLTTSGKLVGDSKMLQELHKEGI